MKAKNLILITVALLLGSSCATAQSRIDRLVEELEEEGCDVNTVVKRDPKTKQVYSTVKSLTFYSKDSKYANRLKEAFKKDAEDAVTESVSNHGNNYMLKFHDGKKRSTYMLTISKGLDKKMNDPLVTLSIVIKSGDDSDFDWNLQNFEDLPLKIEQFKDLRDRIREQAESIAKEKRKLEAIAKAKRP